MCEKSNPGRRQTLKLLATTGLAGLGGAAFGANKGPGAMIPGQGWVNASGNQCEGDGTPLQFMPKSGVDDDPLENDVQKYARCPYCGMNRTQWHHSRHLIHYDDGQADGTCSIHCAAISLALNLDRGPQAIYAADFGADGEVKPLIEVSKATYLVGSKLPGTMSKISKMAFASADAAKAAQTESGGTLSDFDGALKESYLNIADDTIMIRKRRAEKMQKMMQKKKMQG